MSESVTPPTGWFWYEYLSSHTWELVDPAGEIVGRVERVHRNYWAYCKADEKVGSLTLTAKAHTRTVGEFWSFPQAQAAVERACHAARHPIPCIPATEALQRHRHLLHTGASTP